VNADIIIVLVIFKGQNIGWGLRSMYVSHRLLIGPEGPDVTTTKKEKRKRNIHG